MPFADVIAVPLRNIHRHVSAHDRLASEARAQLIVRCLLDAIHLVVIHLGEILRSFFDDHMARGACAASAARMFQMKTEIHRHIEQRFRLSMALVR